MRLIIDSIDETKSLQEDQLKIIEEVLQLAAEHENIER